MNEEEMLRIKTRVEDSLLSMPGVTGVGFTRKRVGGEFTDTLAIIVYVAKKRPPGDVPAAERIPAAIEGIPTDVVESPQIELSAGPPDEGEYPELRSGIQLNGGGTLGFIARTVAGYPRGSGIDVLITNQHVLMGETRAVEPGSSHSVGQPSTHGCCESCDFCSRIVGHQRVACVLDADVDGGTAELVAGVRWAAEVHDSPSVVDIVDVFTITSAAAMPIPVWKRGRTTRRTTGSLTDPNWTSTVLLHDGTVHRRFRASLRIEGADFSEGGDSGSAVLDNSNRIIGLLFGGKGGVHGACHIAKVTSALKVEARTRANTSEGVQVVPSHEPVLNDRNMHAPNLPVYAAADPNGIVVTKAAPRALYARVAATKRGAEFVRALSKHQVEIRKIARIKRVIAAWRLFGGREVTARLSAGLHTEEVLIPNVFQGRSLERRVRGLARVLRAYASPELTAAMACYEPHVGEFAGMRLDAILTVLEGEGRGEPGLLGAVHA